MSWISQFVIAMNLLVLCPHPLPSKSSSPGAISGRLFLPIQWKRDLFVRDDGLLLLGNLAFDEPIQSIKKRESSGKEEEEFLVMCGSVLQSLLCLSRVDHVSMDTGDEKENASYFNGKIFSVVVGSTLEIIIDDLFLPVHIFPSVDETNLNSGTNKKLLVVSITGNDDKIATVSTTSFFHNETDEIWFPALDEETVERRKEKNRSKIIIFGEKPGAISIQITLDDSREIEESNHNLFSYREGKRECSFEVVLVSSHHPIKSVELQELVAVLENYYLHRDPFTIKQCQYFSYPLLSHGLGDIVNLKDLAFEWKECLKLL
jgi:hypothetical protein